MKKKKQKTSVAPRQKHIQVQRGLITKIINIGLLESEFVNGEMVYISYNLSELMTSLGYNPWFFIPRMIKNGYLMVRETDPLSYYLFKSKKQGLTFRRQFIKK
ncbi:MAG: hypothetical protein ACPLW9_00880 [Minisyncoccales bacterium]